MRKRTIGAVLLLGLAAFILRSPRPQPRAAGDRASVSSLPDCPTPDAVARARALHRHAPRGISAVAGSGPSRFSLQDGRVTAFFTETGVSLSLADRRHRRGWGIHWGLVGAQPVPPYPEEEQPTRMHRLVGRAGDWKTDQPLYGSMLYRGVQPGVDLRFEARSHALEYSLQLQPGADPAALLFRYEGAVDVRPLQDGRALEIVTGLGSLRETGLLCYQDGPQGRQTIPARYCRLSPDTVRVEVGDYDRSRELTVDPAIEWATFMGGNQEPDRDSSDYAYAVATDAAGNIYVGGKAKSADFPLVGAFDLNTEAYGDGFVTKIDASGATPSIVWSTYIGAHEQDEIHAIAVDVSGNVYVTGFTNAANFPIVGGFASNSLGSGCFVAKINAAGSALVWSSYLGGLGWDDAWGIAVDSSSNVYVAGETKSTNFPSTGGFQATYGGGASDGFITKINASGASIAWSTYYGSSGADYVYGLAIDSSDRLYATGQLGLGGFLSRIDQMGGVPSVAWTAGFGGTGRGVAVDASGNSYATGDTGDDALVVKVDSTGGLVWGKTLGGSAKDIGRGIAVTAGGVVFVTGETNSYDFPASNGFDASYSFPPDAFVAQLSGAVTPTVDWATYVGGTGQEGGYGVAVDPTGRPVVVGWTSSTDFPKVAAFDSSLISYSDAFVLKINNATLPVTLAWSSLLGGNMGTAGETPQGLTLDAAGNIYLTGRTDADDFPLVGGFDLTRAKGDAYVVKIDATGSSILWSTLLGGSDYDMGSALALDTSGNIYVTGWTLSTDFPVPGGFDTTVSSYDAFVVKINSAGSAILWGTYLGGSSSDYPNAIAVDASGDVLVGGVTYSPDFPATGGFDSTLGGNSDAFLCKIHASGGTLTPTLAWSTYLGGSQDDSISALTIGSDGAVYAVGSTSSIDFPVPNGFSTTFGGSSDAFVVRIADSAGSAPAVLQWGTYWGGPGDDQVQAVAFKAPDTLVVAGTSSGGFPVFGGFDLTYNGGISDVIIGKITNLSGPPVVAWSSYLGGNEQDSSPAVAVNAQGDIYVAGSTLSPNFPLISAFDTVAGIFYEGFVAKISGDGSTLIWSSYLGGSDNDFPSGIAIDGSGHIIVTGNTSSPDFPVVASFDTVLNTAGSGFVVHMTDPAPNPDSDGDGLPDSWEFAHFGNLAQNGAGNPDGDALTNAQEYALGTDPMVFDVDGDGDGLPDAWELTYFGNLSQNGAGDPDGDGLTNAQEYAAGTNPTLADTDGDGISDGIEVTQGLNPLLADQNSNGITDGLEDWDGDGIPNASDPTPGLPGSAPVPPAAPPPPPSGHSNHCGATGMEALMFFLPALIRRWLLRTRTATPRTGRPRR